MLGKGLESLIPSSGSARSRMSSANDVVFEIKHEEIKKEPEFNPAASFRNEDAMSRVPFSRPQTGESVFHIETEKIHSNPCQPRKFFNDDELNELAQSIREFGIIQPIIVSKIVKETDTGTSVEYQLIAGERRLMASRIIGLERIPAIIRRIDSKQRELEIALIENIQRSNLSPIELARSYARLSDEFGITQREIATRVGKSRETVANTIRLLNLPSEAQNALTNGLINESQARTLLTISDPIRQKDAFTRLMSEKISVQELRTEVARPKSIDPELAFWKKRLEEFFGATVKITKQGHKGKLTVQFHSDEEWQGILNKLFEQE